MRTGRIANSRAGALCAIYFNNFHVPELLISFDRSLSSDCPSDKTGYQEEHGGALLCRLLPRAAY